MDMDRVKAFEEFKTHPWLHKVYGRLKLADLALARKFMADNACKSKGDFELAINRMFLDNPNKPKLWREIQELLTCANSSL